MAAHLFHSDFIKQNNLVSDLAARFWIQDHNLMIDSIDSCYLIKQDSILFSPFLFPVWIRLPTKIFSGRRTENEWVWGVWRIMWNGVKTGRKQGAGKKLLVALHLFPSFHDCLFVYCFLPSLARAHTCMLLFNQKVGGSTLFLHDAHEFYEKGVENEVTRVFYFF